MRNGSGDDWFIGFSTGGALINGFAHEAAMSPTEPARAVGGHVHGSPAVTRALSRRARVLS